MIPTEIGRYKILKLIGQGATGTVHHAHDPDLDREVALKLIFLPGSPDDDELRHRFQREVKTASRLNHSHIVTIYDVGLGHKPPYVVMELLKGGTLKERLKQQPLIWQDAVTLLLPLCQSLAYAHRLGIIHRDVKPANVMFAGDEADTLKLVDFGLARPQQGEQMTQAGGVLGTPAYMAPEQARGTIVDARADIFALGLILFESLAGYNPQARDSTG